MKILYIDIDITGHHLTYISELISSNQYESVVCLPEKVDALACRQIVLPADGFGKKRKFSDYYQWLLKIRKICREEKPDIVHFLYGDSLYKFFGIGLSVIGVKKKVITVHSFRYDKLSRLSLRFIAKKASVIVVHSEYIKKSLNEIGIKNAVHIEYPYFNQIEKTKEEALPYFGLRSDIPTVVSLGYTGERKGLDILIKALNQVAAPFQLLVAGKAADFDEKYIMENGKAFSERISLKMSFLTDEEFAMAVVAADIIALPYRKSFNGASGPLGEGVAHHKCIVASDHGNLGYTVSSNHLGYVFETENPDALAAVLDKALYEKFVPDQKYKAYQESLNPEYFKGKYQELYWRMENENCPNQ